MIKESERIVLVPNSIESIYEKSEEIPPSVKMVGATDYWQQGFTGRNVIVAVIDTGCQMDHPDLKSNIIAGKNFTPDDEGDIDNYQDYVFHGTHVAGIIAGTLNDEGIVGVAPDAKLLILKAIPKTGQGSYDYLIKAINYAVSWRGAAGQRVRIITMSLGGSNDSVELHEAIKRAIQANILVVCAAGNSGDNDLETDEFMYPGYYQEVVQVGAVDSDCLLAPFSNTNDQIDIYAPGVSILSTIPKSRYAEMSGTSMSAPHVAGAAALLISKLEQFTSSEITEAELFTALSHNTNDLGKLKILKLK
ncbi:S8 family peptidase [Paenibacillus silvae]|jgi:major intracellular serine protease|uniref:S8 family peptidase n=1 Tax=Paenibacillus silvae TaxID=1325358 RepID=UPI0025A2122E|nr:S8 family peptidase [Paenibacillus silvae]MDM5280063.1 S8 family peptidase [Paenibacillus silvae]